MHPSLKRIANKARKAKQHRFQNLYRLIDEELLHDSWKQLNRHAALGIDEVSYEEYGRDLDENITNLVKRLKEKRYRAKLVKRQYIPKGKGKWRPLGLIVIEDKLLQHAVTQMLSAVYEADFLPISYAYRPGKGAHDAVNDLQRELRYGGYTAIVDCDISGFFDNIDHNWMIRMLEERIDDKALIQLIRKWLKAGILETKGQVIHPETGTPQGGIISPVLANIYMHYVLNMWFEKVVKKHCKGKAYLSVYADDFVCAFEHESDGKRFYKVLGKRLGKFGLELSDEKTSIIRFSRHQKERNGTFEYLGFNFRWQKSRSGKDWLKRTTSKSRLRKTLTTFTQWCRKNRHKRSKEFVKTLNAKLRGYYNYYGVIGNYDGLSRFFYYATRILFKWLNRRSQKKSYSWAAFKDFLCAIRIEKPRITNRTTNIIELFA